ncbi:MAG TPA: hypothetical protein VH764_18025 [Gemmatimonadales bacterium]|jgi:hypothetical protein
MTLDRRSGFLLLLAAAAFWASAFLTSPRRPLGFVAAALLTVAGVVQLLRARRS